MKKAHANVVLVPLHNGSNLEMEFVDTLSDKLHLLISYTIQINKKSW